MFVHTYFRSYAIIIDVTPPIHYHGRPAVSVNVLENDEDPDGSIDEVTLTTADAGVTVSGSNLLIPTSESTRLVV